MTCLCLWLHAAVYVKSFFCWWQINISSQCSLKRIKERIQYKIISLTTYSAPLNHVIYVRNLINIKPHGSTRSSDCLALVYPHISSIKISIAFFSKLPLPSEIIYNPTWKPLLTLYLTHRKRWWAIFTTLTLKNSN